MTNNSNEFIDLSYLDNDKLIENFSLIIKEGENISKDLGDKLREYAFFRKKFDSYLNEIKKRDLKVNLEKDA